MRTFAVLLLLITFAFIHSTLAQSNTPSPITAENLDELKLLVP